MVVQSDPDHRVVDREGERRDCPGKISILAAPRADSTQQQQSWRHQRSRRHDQQTARLQPRGSGFAGLRLVQTVRRLDNAPQLRFAPSSKSIRVDLARTARVRESANGATAGIRPSAKYPLIGPARLPSVAAT